MDPVTLGVLASVIGGTVASGVGAGLAPNPYQERESFRGSGADPVSWLSQGRGALTDTFNSVATRANEPIDVSGTQVQQPRRVSGGILPMSIGVTGGNSGSPSSATTPKRVPLDFMRSQPGDFGGSTTGQRWPAFPGQDPVTPPLHVPGVPYIPEAPGTGPRTDQGNEPPRGRPIPKNPDGTPRLPRRRPGSDIKTSASFFDDSSAGAQTPGQAAARLMLLSLQKQQGRGATA